MHHITTHTAPPPNSKTAAYGYVAFDYQKVGYNATEINTSTNSPLYSWGAGNKSGQWEANGEEAFLFLDYLLLARAKGIFFTFCRVEQIECVIIFGSFCFNTKTNKDNQYFYHGDHLGSSSWITDGAGDVNQYLAYMPFGEQFIDQRATHHDIHFKFTGKERDSETGFDYFGARYFASDLSVWLSVDPLSELSSGISPYAYVNNNPIMLIDEWGLTPGPIRKLKQWLKRRKKGIKVKKVPYVTREVKFKKVVLANGQIDGSIDSKLIAKDGTFPIKEEHSLNKYLGNAESFKITFNTSTDISIIQKERNKEDKAVFNGRKGENETDWITLRSNHRRHFSINYEKVFILDKKLAAVVAYYKNYQVSANITASESYFRHLEKMADRDARKTEYLKGRSKTF